MRGLVNRERNKAGLAPLRLDAILCVLAGLKARDMQEARYFGHRSDRLGRMSDMAEHLAGIRGRIGENIALNFPDAASVHRAWMCSVLHRNNILDGKYRRFGYGYADLNGERRIWVQVFADDEQC